MISKICKNVFIGEYSDVVSQFDKTPDENRRLLENLKRLGISDVLSLCNSDEEDCLNKKEERSFKTNQLAGIQLHHQPISIRHSSCKETFKLALEKINQILSENPKAKVLIHCFGGVDRAPFLAAAFLSFSRQIQLNDAYSDIRKIRPFVVEHYEWKWWLDPEVPSL